jgi:hypothetical protein
MKTFRTLLLVLACIAYSCDTEKEAAPSQEELLTGSSSKKWHLISNTQDPELSDESCTVASARNQDNIWTYFKGGRFEFDNGTNNGDACETCCIDQLDYYGHWKIQDGKIKVVAEGLIISGVEIPNDIEQVAFNEILTELTKDKLVIEHSPYVMTFHASN